MRYRCRSKNCTASYQSERGLSGHRLVCEHYKLHEKAALARRTELGQRNKAARQEALEKIKQDLKQRAESVSNKWFDNSGFWLTKFTGDQY